MSHGDRVDALPQGFVAKRRHQHHPVRRHERRTPRFYGVQFHPSDSHSAGHALLERFVREICASDAL